MFESCQNNMLCPDIDLLGRCLYETNYDINLD